MKENLKRVLLDFEIPDEKITPLLSEICMEIGKVTVPKQEFNTKSCESKKLKDELLLRDNMIEDLKKTAAISDDLSNRLSELKTKHKTEMLYLSDELHAIKFEYAIELELMKAKSRNTKAVRALLDFNKIKLSDKYGIIGLYEQIVQLKKSDAYLFEKTNVKKHRSPSSHAKRTNNNS